MCGCDDVYVEAPPKKKKNGEYYWDPVIKGWVKLTGVTVSVAISSV